MPIFRLKLELATGFDNRLLRFSVGIEDADDLIQDLRASFRYM